MVSDETRASAEKFRHAKHSLVFTMMGSRPS